MKYQFHVEGMTCAVCSGAVEKVVSRVEGVLRAAVNLSAKTLFCECDKRVDPAQIIRAVEAAGFSASLKGNEKKGPAADEVRKTMRRLIASCVFLLPLLYLSMGHMLSLPLPACFDRHSAPLAHAVLQLFLTVPVLFLNRGFFVRGVRAVGGGRANMDTLVALGSAAAFLYSLWEIGLLVFGRVSELGSLYFESAAMILTLVTFGKFLESRAKDQTAGALSNLIELAPKTVRVLRAQGECEVAAEEIVSGDLVLLRPGERIPVDGVVKTGQSTLDMSMLTGESLPVDVSAGSEVLSGSINLSGALQICAAKSAGESTLSQMIALVEEAGVSRAPVAHLADRIAGIFVPAVSLIALFTTVLWLILGYDFGFSLGLGISVLVVSCPCALGLATPVAVTAALGKCASRGVLVREARVFDDLCTCDTVLLDKTGTITEGAPGVTDAFCTIEEEEFLSLAASLEEASEHPLARAVCRYAEGKRRRPIQNFEAVFGRGVRATCEETLLLGGNAAFLSEHGVDLSPVLDFAAKAEGEGKTVLYFARESALIGALALSDRIKPSSPGAVSALGRLKKEVIMLTGDRARAAEAIASESGIHRVISEILPQGKEEEVRRLQADGHRVAMVGDGINDAPALSRATVGISVGSAADIAKNSAEVILLYNDLSALPELFGYARRVSRVIRQNLFWAFFYNCCAIPVAAGALYVPFGIVLSPMIAAACMSLSSLFVVTNALRLYRGKEKKK